VLDAGIHHLVPESLDLSDHPVAKYDSPVVECDRDPATFSA
jgi:hypothetical protein